MDKKLFQEICDTVISINPAIRFAGIADEDGELLAFSERKGLTPLLTPEERAQYAITAATRQYTRLRWESHLGKINYASSHYAKLMRATIPITDENNRLAYVLLMSLDVGTADFHNIIMKHVIPLVNNYRETLKNDSLHES
ncbi:MAG TPA: PDC sensor domain-containing protein [Nitrososphaeraceae archaeon]